MLRVNLIFATMAAYAATANADVKSCKLAKSVCEDRTVGCFTGSKSFIKPMQGGAEQVFCDMLKFTEDELIAGLAWAMCSDVCNKGTPKNAVVLCVKVTRNNEDFWVPVVQGSHKGTMDKLEDALTKELQMKGRCELTKC